MTEPMSKGDQTKQAVLEEALDLASEVGLEGLTIGSLAKRSGLSKSGLYAHFESKEDLQCQVLDAAAAAFVDRVLAPAMKQPRGEARLRKLFDGWLDWECDCHSGGCPFISATVEFDDRPGPVRDRLTKHLHDILDVLARGAEAAIEEGEFDDRVDTQRFAFEVWGLLLAYQSYSRLLERPNALAQTRESFEALLGRMASPTN